MRGLDALSARMNLVELRQWVDIGVGLSDQSAECGSAFFEVSPKAITHLGADSRLLLMALLRRAATHHSDLSVEQLRSALNSLSKLHADNATSLLLRTVSDLSQSSVGMCCSLLMTAADTIAAMELSSPAREQLLLRSLTLLGRVSDKSVRRANEFLAELRPVLLGIGAPGPEGDRAVELYRPIIDIAERLSNTSDFLAESFFITGAGLVKLKGMHTVEKWGEVFELITQGSHSVAQFPSLTRDRERYCEMLSGALAEIAALGSREGNERMLDAVLEEVLKVAKVSVDAGFKCFLASPLVLRQLTLAGFSKWVGRGLELTGETRRALEAYFGFESRLSHENAEGGEPTIRLDQVIPVLAHYIKGLTGKMFVIAATKEIAPLTEVADGKTIRLPESIKRFDTVEDNFRMYKVLAARAAGRLEFDDPNAESLQSIREQLEETFWFQVRDRRAATPTPAQLLKLFPQRLLAERMFAILEEVRIECRLRQRYRGLARDLQWACSRRVYRRPEGVYLLGYEPLLELMYQALLMKREVDDGEKQEQRFLRFAEDTAGKSVAKPDASVADTLYATFQIYRYLDPRPPEDSSAPWEAQPDNSADPGKRERSRPASQPESQPARGQAMSDEELALAPAAGTGEAGSRPMTDSACEATAPASERGVFYYDEWDTTLSDHRVAWCKVRVTDSPAEDSGFVARARARYAGVLSSITHQFQMLRPQGLKRLSGQLDGDDLDLQALLDSVIDRKTGLPPSERIYTQRLRRQRDVVVLFLVDLSSSTHRSVDDTQRKVIDIEKESLVMMSEALESVGDRYAIYGFSSHGRKSVSLYRVKTFDEPFSARVERRIAGMKPLVNTRLGAAVRHATSLLVGEEHLTKLLILITDGRPYDDDDGYNVVFYGRDDTRHALIEAKSRGVTPFCITIDASEEPELKKIYGEVGYTIVDDVLSLPERLPAIYRRLTT